MPPLRCPTVFERTSALQTAPVLRPRSGVEGQLGTCSRSSLISCLIMRVWCKKSPKQVLLFRPGQLFDRPIGLYGIWRGRIHLLTVTESQNVCVRTGLQGSRRTAPSPCRRFDTSVGICPVKWARESGPSKDPKCADGTYKTAPKKHIQRKTAFVRRLEAPSRPTRPETAETWSVFCGQVIKKDSRVQPNCLKSYTK